MKILSFEQKGGDLRAALLASPAEIERFGGARGAVEACIRLFADERGLPPLALPRVTRMEDAPGGGVEFDFDAAVPPAVELGQYLGLEVYVPSDEEPDLWVLRAAAERMRCEIPGTYIERKIDALERQRFEDVAQRTGFVTLADMAAILRAADAAQGLGRSGEELWEAAVAAADELSGARLRAHSAQEICAIIARALYGEGAEDEGGAIAAALDARAEEKRRADPETLAAECFDCYLRLAGKSEAELRAELRAQAEELVRFDLLIDEVARREELSVSDEEFDAALGTIAGMYEMHPAEVLQLVGAEALRDRLRRDKARAMIVGSAKQI